MRFVPLFTVFFLLGASFISIQQPTADELCSKYDWKTFYLLPEVNEKIDPIKPNYDLLNACVFHVTNEQREKAGRTAFRYSYELKTAAVFHSEQMLEKKFFSIKNNKDTAYLTPAKRIDHLGGKFILVGENIIRVTVMNYNKEKFTVYKQGDVYKYFSKNGKEEIEPDTYLNFAKRAVDEIMKIDMYKANILFKKFEFLGCGVKVVPDPYRTRKMPLVYVTQDFGGYKK